MSDWLLSKKAINNKCRWRFVEKEPLYTVGENVNWCSHCRKQYGISLKKLKIRNTIQSSSTTSGHQSGKNENTSSKRYICFYVHWSIVYNSQDMDSIYMSIDRWMDKDVIYTQWNITQP